MTKYLCDKEAIAKANDGFETRSNIVLIGTIGPLDGRLVCIIRPSWWRDGITNTMYFFSCKGLYALNIQCIVND